MDELPSELMDQKIFKEVDMNLDGTDGDKGLTKEEMLVYLQKIYAKQKRLYALQTPSTGKAEYNMPCDIH